MLSKENIKPKHFEFDPDDEIVISGISGRFAKSRNFSELSHNLYNKINMVDDDEVRWRRSNPTFPKYAGTISDLDKFDATFFGYQSKNAQTMDPQGRMLLEHAYEAVLDAGVNPKSLRNSKTGVFVGICYCESEKTWFYEKDTPDGLGLSGNSRSLLANRLSFTLGLTGPSLCCDTACSSSMYALDLAYKAIRNGDCDAAIVGASNLLLHPLPSLQFARLGVLSIEGFCSPFDANAKGYTRSEAVAVLLLQKKSVAKRNYGTLVYTKSNCDGFKSEGIHYPSGTVQKRLLEEFYDDLSLSPSSVDYIEAHSTGTIAGDPEECKAIEQVFCKDVNAPIPIGSIKSNLGHSEASSGICSISKVILTFHNSKIPPNINYTSPRPEIPALFNGKLKVVDEVQDFNGSLICVNSFGFGGANSHALLKISPKVKENFGIPKDNIPRLVVWSGRTEEAVNEILNSVTKQQLDAEYIALLHNSQLESVPQNIYKGFGLFTQSSDSRSNATCLLSDVQHFGGLKRPIVWVYSGMGSQWAGMGSELMKISIFASAIEKCHKVLYEKGINLKEIITSKDPGMFDNILHSFVGIAAIQVGLTDVLRAIGLEPDHIIGHSVGELGCGYADGCFTAEEMVLCAYSRGMASLETKVVRGSMAAVGLGYQKLKNMVPDEVCIACHNSNESSTISGPCENISKFVDDLKAKGVFAKEVACSNIPYHSKYIADFGPNLLKRLNDVIKEPKKRSSKWISSSYSKSMWHLEKTQYSSADYHTNNLLSSVLFEEASSLLPENAICIEIAPHGLLQAILKRSMPKAVNIPLTQREHKHNDQVLLNAIGKIYCNGFDVKLSGLYPKVDFPVSRGTPMISPYIKWEHSESWFVPYHGQADVDKSAERIVRLNIGSPDFEFIAGHTIDGRCLFPATGYLFLAWETLGLMKGRNISDCAVEFEDIKFLRATNITDTNIAFTIVIQPGTGRFEISEGTTALVTGAVKLIDKAELTKISVERDSKNVLTTNDFYKELRLRGYHYNGLFKSVLESSYDGTYGRVKWSQNWIAFLDCLLQIQIVGKDTRSLFIPTSIQKMTVDPINHFTSDINEKEEPFFNVFVSKNLKILRSGGVEIVNLQASPVQRRKSPSVPVLESYQFIPYDSSQNINVFDAARVIVQLALENNTEHVVKAVETDNLKKKIFLPFIRDALLDLPLITPNLTYLTSRTVDTEDQVTVENTKLSANKKCMLVILSQDNVENNLVEEAQSCLIDGGFLIIREDLDKETIQIINSNFLKIGTILTEVERLVLFRCVKQQNTKQLSAIHISNNDSSFEWIEETKKLIKNGPLILVSENEPDSGLIGLVNCMMKEPEGKSIRCVFIDDPKAPKFSLSDPFYLNQLKLELAINVYRNGKWGSYRHLQIERNFDEENVQRHCYVNSLVKSDLSSLKWLEGPNSSNEKLNNLVTVHYAALNFRDVMLATGKLSADVFAENRFEHECLLGMEFSGKTKDGKRVMGLVSSGALATSVKVDPLLLFEIPKNWSLADAATVPCVYGTVYSAFFVSTTIEKGKSILIHAGTGGVGLAAIRVALAYGLEVFTTVSTEEKKNFLLKEFPQLKAENIGNSRDTTFEKLVIDRTSGKGVDYVLNSLAEEKLHASIRCLGFGGKFLEIGKFDMANDTKIGMSIFLKELSFHSVMLDKLFNGSEWKKLQLKQILEKDIRAGIVKPLKTNIYPANQVEKAFRFLASGKHMGKVLLEIRENENATKTLPITVLPRLYCNPEQSYIIPGGLGGFGLELADWLVLRGCKKLVLSSSRGITKQYQLYRIKIWESYGVKIVIKTSNISTKSGCEELIEEAMKMGPVGGIFNLAVLLRDAIFENQDASKFAECMAPKALATKYLDEISRALCPELQYFVIFSSVSCGRGNAGQSNYGMANSVMERIIEQRHKAGLPAKAIQWGAVGEVGLVADMQEDKIDMEIGGTLQQRISSCLEELDTLICCNEPVVSSMVVAEKKSFGISKGNIVETVKNIMGIRDIKSISLETTLSEMGMDSLMAVELKQIFEREFDVDLTMQELRSLNFLKIMEIAQKQESKEKTEIKFEEKAEDSNILSFLIRHVAIRPVNDNVIQYFNEDKKQQSKCLGIVIPGIEGSPSESMLEMCSKLNFPYCIINYNNSTLCKAKSAKEVVEFIKNDILKALEGYERFHLIVHSYGSFLAIVLATFLEREGKRGYITDIDGSPVSLHNSSKSQFQQKSEGEFHDYVLTYIASVIDQNIDKSLLSLFANFGTWDEKLEKFLEVTSYENYYTKDYFRSVLNALYYRINSMLNETEDLGYVKNTKCTLIKPSEEFIPSKSENYELDKYFKQDIDVIQLDGNHQSIIENSDIVTILNEIHSKIL